MKMNKGRSEVNNYGLLFVLPIYRF